MLLMLNIPRSHRFVQNVYVLGILLINVLRKNWVIKGSKNIGHNLVIEVAKNP